MNDQAASNSGYRHAPYHRHLGPTYRPLPGYQFRPWSFARADGSGDLLLVVKHPRDSFAIEAVRLQDLRFSDIPPVLPRTYRFDQLRLVIWQTLDPELLGATLPSSWPVVAAVLEERQRQHERWGLQRHSLERWGMILAEEVGEVLAAIGEHIFRSAAIAPIRAELVQVAAVAVQIVEAIDREQGSKS